MMEAASGVWGPHTLSHKESLKRKRRTHKVLRRTAKQAIRRELCELRSADRSA